MERVILISGGPEAAVNCRAGRDRGITKGETGITPYELRELARLRDAT